MSSGWVFVTSNANKWLEAQRILGYAIERVELELEELQAESIGMVAMAKAKAAYQRLGRPVIVEDAGVELHGLGGFPGPFIKYWEKLGGLRSICRAVDGSRDRAVCAVCVLAIATDDGVACVEGRAPGTIAEDPRGTNGFGWDAIFIPDGDTRTFAEMTADEKDARSHRRRAWDAFRGRGV